MLDIAYTHPRDGKLIQIRQAIRIRRDEPFTLHAGERAELVGWGVMPSGMLRHPLFVRWLARSASSSPLARLTPRRLVAHDPASAMSRDTAGMADELSYAG